MSRESVASGAPAAPADTVAIHPGVRGPRRGLGRRAMIAVAALAALLGGAELYRRRSSAGQSVAGVSVHALPVELPDLRFTDENGASTGLASFRGRVVLLNVWATWCPPCREEMPTLDRLQWQLGGPGFEVVTLSIDSGGLPAVQAFFRQIGIQHLRPYLDGSHAGAALVGAGIPLTLLVDKDGREVARKLGPATWDDPQIVGLIRRYLPAPPAQPDEPVAKAEFVGSKRPRAANGRYSDDQVMMLKVLISAALSLALLACDERPESSPQASPFTATDITGADWGRDFHLTDHNGRPRALADFKGKVVMLYFGYTHCPDMCPATLAQMAQVRSKLGDQGERVQGLFATVDPERDTPDVLAQYVPAFDPSFLGLYGDEDTTAALAKDFKTYFGAQKADAKGHYSVDHSGGIYVFDPSGRLRLMMRPGAGVDAMTADLAVLLKG